MCVCVCLQHIGYSEVSPAYIFFMRKSALGHGFMESLLHTLLDFNFHSNNGAFCAFCLCHVFTASSVLA